MGVEIIRIKAVLSLAGLAYWTGTELGNNKSVKEGHTAEPSFNGLHK